MLTGLSASGFFKKKSAQWLLFSVLAAAQGHYWTIAVLRRRIWRLCWFGDWLEIRLLASIRNHKVEITRWTKCQESLNRPSNHLFSWTTDNRTGQGQCSVITGECTGDHPKLDWRKSVAYHGHVWWACNWEKDLLGSKNQLLPGSLTNWELELKEKRMNIVLTG